MAASMRVCVLQIQQKSTMLCTNFARLTLSPSNNLCSSASSQLERTFRTSNKTTITHSTCLRQPTITLTSLVSSLPTPLRNRCIHTSSPTQGFEEFFETKKNLGEEKIRSGREWKVNELRLKDNVTLHKLWYVLLKERNMLMTMEEEANRLEVEMPSPERFSKVEASMENLKQVVQERDEAVIELKTGQKELHPGRWVKTVFGYRRFVKPKEYLLPKHMNKQVATKREKYGRYMTPYIRSWMEKDLRFRLKANKIARRKERKLRQQFPDADVWKED